MEDDETKEPAIQDIWPLSLEEARDLNRIEAFDYTLPEELIATEPAPRREESRLLTAKRGSLDLEMSRFGEIRRFLRPGDLLVFNNTRVIPARLQVFKDTGGRVELFILNAPGKDGRSQWEKPSSDGSIVFECMSRSSKPLRPGSLLSDQSRPFLPQILVEEAEAGMARVRVSFSESPLTFLEEFGEIPLPPYIVRQRLETGKEALSEEDERRYQTVFASVAGAVAAPTAGLHFSPSLLEELESLGVERTELTLTVGPGTFQPVRHEDLSEHPMHREEYYIPEGLGAKLRACQDRGGRIIAVGTTSARALEAEARRTNPFEEGWRSTDIFLRPGMEFLCADGLITNFHLPRSTLLTLVAAFLGYEEMRSLYNHAIAEGLHFYSYGDATLLWR